MGYFGVKLQFEKKVDNTKVRASEVWAKWSNCNSPSMWTIDGKTEQTDIYPKGLWWEALYFSAFTSSLTKYFGKISWDFLFLIKELTILFLAHQRMGNIHRFKESYPEIKVSYPEIRVLYCLKILKITVIWPFQSQLIREATKKKSKKISQQVWNISKNGEPPPSPYFTTILADFGTWKSMFFCNY